MDWKYLESPILQWRYVLAAHLVRKCEYIVEIGGAKTPITDFLTGSHMSVTVCDPLIGPTEIDSLFLGRIRHINKNFQECDLPESGIGLVLLGMHVKGDVEPLFDLVDKAGVTIIEFSTGWEPAEEQFQAILDNTEKNISSMVRMDFSGNDLGSMKNSWPPRLERELYTLE